MKKKKKRQIENKCCHGLAGKRCNVSVVPNAPALAGTAVEPSRTAVWTLQPGE